MDSINAPEVRVPVSSNISLPHTLAETAEVVCEVAPRERIRGLLPQSDRTFGSPKCLTLASVLNNNMNMQSRPFERSLFFKTVVDRTYTSSSISQHVIEVDCPGGFSLDTTLRLAHCKQWTHAVPKPLDNPPAMTPFTVESYWTRRDSQCATAVVVTVSVPTWV